MIIVTIASYVSCNAKYRPPASKTIASRIYPAQSHSMVALEGDNKCVSAGGVAMG